MFKDAVNVYKEIGSNDIALFVICFMLVFGFIYYVTKIRPEETKQSNQTWALMKESMIRQEGLMQQCNALMAIMNKTIEVQTETLNRVNLSNECMSRQIAVIDEKITAHSMAAKDIHDRLRELATEDQVQKVYERLISNIVESKAS